MGEGAAKKAAATKKAPAAKSAPKPVVPTRHEGDGWRVVLKINLPPEAQYHSGHSVLFQGDDAAEVTYLLAHLIAGSEGPATQEHVDQARFILLQFVEFAAKSSLKQALGATEAPAPASTDQSAPVERGSAATSTLVAFAARKLGVSPAELVDKTEDEIKALLRNA